MSADLREVLKRLGKRWRQAYVIQEYLKRQLKREEERMIRSLYEDGR